MAARTITVGLPSGVLTDADLSDTAPADLSTAAAGVSTEASRADHVHDMPTAADVGATPATIIDAKGDLIAGTAADTAGRLAVSATNGATLVADSSTATGLNWAVDPFVVTLPGANPTLLAAIANYAFAMRVFGAGTISKVALQIGTASGNICVGVYSNTGVGPNATPNARLATSGSVACPASGYREVALTTSVEVRTGDWLVVAFDNASATFYGVAAPGSGLANNGLVRAAASSFPLPTTFTASTNHDRSVRLWGIP